LYGSGRSITALMTEKIEVLTATPSASVIAATAVKPRFFTKARTA